MKLRFLTLGLSVVLFALVISACSDDDDPVTPPSNTADYFPFGKGIVWTYETNVFHDDTDSIVTMNLKIDTSSTNNGVFQWLMVRFPDYDATWHRTIALLDSAGIVYSLGDHPRETLFPLFKHKYSESESTRETITIKGTSYQTVRVTVQAQNNASVTWWFADGIGLVREHSMQGVSLFSDDNDDEVLTELVSYTR